jgi:hypothetical protein
MLGSLILMGGQTFICAEALKPMLRIMSASTLIAPQKLSQNCTQSIVSHA